VSRVLASKLERASQLIGSKVANIPARVAESVWSTFCREITPNSVGTMSKLSIVTADTRYEYHSKTSKRRRHAAFLSNRHRIGRLHLQRFAAEI
jgi:hypothetical protein